MASLHLPCPLNNAVQKQSTATCSHCPQQTHKKQQRLITLRKLWDEFGMLCGTMVPDVSWCKEQTNSPNRDGLVYPVSSLELFPMSSLGLPSAWPALTGQHHLLDQLKQAVDRTWAGPTGKKEGSAECDQTGQCLTISPFSENVSIFCGWTNRSRPCDSLLHNDKMMAMNVFETVYYEIIACLDLVCSKVGGYFQTANETPLAVFFIVKL